MHFIDSDGAPAAVSYRGHRKSWRPLSQGAALQIFVQYYIKGEVAGKDSGITGSMPIYVL